MPSFSIINEATGDVYTSGTVPDAAVEFQKVPPGHVLVRGVLAIPKIHRVVNGARVDIPQAPAVQHVDRLDAIIEALSAKGVTLTEADISAATNRVRAKGK